MRILSILFLFISFFSTALHADYKCDQQRCIIVIDAGSSGTRLHFFSYDIDATNTPIKINEQKALGNKISPGFSTLDPEKVNSYLENLFIKVSPQDTPIPVYFYATAGMRLLSQPQQAKLYNKLEEWFKNNSKWSLIKAKTITGAEEGLFAWLAINYQLNLLEDHTQSSAGVIDIGGASSQIAFQIKDQHDKNPNIKRIKLFNREFAVFTQSFLGLGQVESSHQFLNTPSCFPTNYILPNATFAQGDAYACKEATVSLVNGVHGVKNKVPSIMQVNKWYVLGGISYLVQSKPFEFPKQEFTLGELIEVGNREICTQNWTELSNLYPNDNYLYTYCLLPAYYYALIIEGYGLHPQQNLLYLTNNQSNDWTTGVVLYQIR